MPKAVKRVRHWRFQILDVLTMLLRKVEHMTDKIDDLSAAVADLKATQTDQLAAIDVEIKQLADAIAAGTSTGLTPDQVARLQGNIDNIVAATDAMKASTAALASDDAPVPPPA